MELINLLNVAKNYFFFALNSSRYSWILTHSLQIISDADIQILHIRTFSLQEFTHDESKKSNPHMLVFAFDLERGLHSSPSYSLRRFLLHCSSFRSFSTFPSETIFPSKLESELRSMDKSVLLSCTPNMPNASSN